MGRWSVLWVSGIDIVTGGVKGPPSASPICAGVYFCRCECQGRYKIESNFWVENKNTSRQKVWHEMILWDEKLLEKPHLVRVSGGVWLCECVEISMQCLDPGGEFPSQMSEKCFCLLWLSLSARSSHSPLDPCVSRSPPAIQGLPVYRGITFCPLTLGHWPFHPFLH